MDINKQTLKETTNCEKNFGCLNGHNHVYCKVESCVNNEVHFVKCLNEDHCLYKMNFGDSIICSCPIRKEIYNKYGL